MEATDHKFTYSVIDNSGTDDLFVKQFYGDSEALSIASLCRLYHELTHISGDTILTTENFQQYGGKIGHESIVIVLGDLITVRLTRHDVATEMSMAESGCWKLLV